MDNKSINTSYRIVFMGTPLFAVPTLDALHGSRHQLLKIVTQPDRPKGRGRKITPPPVKERALNLGYQVYQPETIKSKEAYTILSSLEADIFVIIAFGQIIPKALLDVPKRVPSICMPPCSQNTAALRPFSGQLSMERKKPA